MRRVRATFLLRCVVFAACLAAFFGLYSWRPAPGWAAVWIAFLALFWLLGLETGLPPLLIERFLARRAARRGEPVFSIWFVDEEVEENRTQERLQDKTRDNPTVR